MAIYHRYGYRFISIYPKNLDNLDWVFRKKFETAVGYMLPDNRKWVTEDMQTCSNCGLYYDALEYDFFPNCGSDKRDTVII